MRTLNFECIVKKKKNLNKNKKEKTSGNRKENSFCSSSCFTLSIYIY